MKTLLLAAALAVSASSTLATDVGVSVTIGQPGFYGHIDIGDFPRPRLIYAEPRLILRGPVAAPPVYMHVPPGHAKNWRKHCGRYDACGRPVYFVQDNWYNTVYVPRYQERERGRGGPSRHDDRRGDHDDHDDDRRGGKPDKGSHGKGQGNGRGRD